MQILFVCTANIVRSFMAEALAREMLRRKSRRDIVVASAALVDMQGAPPDPAAVKILLEKGIDPGQHHSRLLDDKSVAGADLIAVMERLHKEVLVRQYPAAEEKIRLLKSFTKGFQEFDADISDPHGLTVFQYRLCFAEISLAVEGLLSRL